MTGTSWATGIRPQRELLSYLPVGPGDPEPAYAIADAWQPPDPMALPNDLCDRLVAAAAYATPAPRANGDYRQFTLEPDDEAAVVTRFDKANHRWWGLVIDRWDVFAKRYGPGHCHSPHQDLHAGAARRKMAGSVQLSNPDDYRGGDLVVAYAHRRATMPRTRGTLVAFPGWTVHEVEPVTEGERWALIINGFGPPLR